MAWTGDDFESYAEDSLVSAISGWTVGGAATVKVFTEGGSKRAGIEASPSDGYMERTLATGETGELTYDYKWSIPGDVLTVKVNDVAVNTHQFPAASSGSDSLTGLVATDKVTFDFNSGSSGSTMWVDNLSLPSAGDVADGQDAQIPFQANRPTLVVLSPKAAVAKNAQIPFQATKPLVTKLITLAVRSGQVRFQSPRALVGDVRSITVRDGEVRFQADSPYLQVDDTVRPKNAEVAFQAERVAVQKVVEIDGEDGQVWFQADKPTVKVVRAITVRDAQIPFQANRPAVILTPLDVESGQILFQASRPVVTLSLPEIAGLIPESLLPDDMTLSEIAPK